MTPTLYGKLAVVLVIVAAILWALFRDLRRVRIVFKGGHVETLWLANIKVTNGVSGDIVKMEWVKHRMARKRLMDINLSEVAAILWQ